MLPLKRLASRITFFSERHKVGDLDNSGARSDKMCTV